MMQTTRFPKLEECVIKQPYDYQSITEMIQNGN